MGSSVGADVRVVVCGAALVVGEGLTVGGVPALGGGLAARPKIDVCVGGLAGDCTKLTITEWLTVMLILAVLPSTSKTGPSHSSTSQPGSGDTSIVTVRPWMY